MRKNKQSIVRRVNNWLHLWLGLISSVVVFVVCLTAAIWTFRYEITYYFEKGNQVEKQDKAYVTPAILRENALAYLRKDDKDMGHINSIFYRAGHKSIVLNYSDSLRAPAKQFYFNPYDGRVILHRDKQSVTQDFIDFLRAGHRFFWMPRHIGSPFVGTNCLVFLLLLITGLVWWYPKKWNKSTRDKSFKIKWSANWKRVNLDLHNVLGFYAAFFAIILTVTGLYYSFTWFREGYHFVITAGKTIEKPVRQNIKDNNQDGMPVVDADDILFKKHYDAYLAAGYEALYIFYPQQKNGPINLQLRPYEDGQYGAISYIYDTRTLKPMGRNENQPPQNFGQKVFAANFDIHVGSIGGIWTKILASLISLIGASLPVTGFIIWYNRKWGKKKVRPKNRERRNPIVE
ncbi:PepSY-associated TM helix domain-containing protein [Sphingobacterium sp. Mn56C]|uniref:PepSY-associated TM helix domain-containing protein n=1 Tax=Sphingobacterium sp. Mn56C TaxID=3395261 RepID=UPI003BE80007